MPPGVEITQANSSVQAIAAALTATDAGFFQFGASNISGDLFDFEISLRCCDRR
jgi:hypothetical protein